MFAFMAACGVDDALGSCLFGAVDACSASIIFAVAGLVLMTVDAPCLGLNHVSPIHAGPSMSLLFFWVVSLKLSMTSAVGLPGPWSARTLGVARLWNWRLPVFDDGLPVVLKLIWVDWGDQCCAVWSVNIARLSRL